MNKIRKGVLDLGSYFSVTFLSKGVGLITLPILTKFLAKDEIGELSETLRIITLISLFLGLGYTSQLIRTTKDKTVEKEYLAISKYFVLATLILFPLVFNNLETVWLIFFSSLGLALLNFHRTEYRILKKTRKYVLNEYIFLTVSTLLTILLVILKPVYESRIIGLSVAYVVVIILYLREFKFWINKPSKFNHLKEALTILPHNILRWIRVSSDVVLIGLFYASAVQADFAIATSVASISLITFDTYNQWFISVAKQNFDSREISKWINYLVKSFLGYTVILFIVNYLSKYFYIIFEWSEFLDGFIYILPLTLIYYIRSLINLLTTYFNYFGLNNLLSIITLTSSIIYLIVSYYGLQNSVYNFLWLSCILEGLIFLVMFLDIIRRNDFSFS